MKNFILVCAVTSAMLALSSCAVAGYQPPGYVATTLAPDADIDRAERRGTTEALAGTLWAQNAHATQTATARAYAAGMTATRDAQGAQATGTALIAAAAYSQTAQALGAMQTQVAITLTAAAAISVEVAAMDAARTATENYFTSGARVAAEMTQSASDAKAAERIDTAWTVLWIGVVACFLVGVVSLLVLGLLWIGAGVSERWAQADGEHATTWHLWNPTAAKGETQETPTMSETGADDDEIRRARWRRNLEIFLRAGDRHGFAIRDLGPAGLQIVSQPGWEAITGWMRQPAIGVLRVVGKTTTWGDGWDLERAVDALRRGTLPCPPGAVVDVSAPVNSATKTTVTTLPE